ncbi:MAG: signal peptidase I [Planctomycetes bacterium]|nr:signal peptidase I [Planctomycetota bacterium]
MTTTPGSTPLAAAPSEVGPDSSDEELEAVLVAREEKEAEDVMAVVRSGLKGDQPCPVCAAPIEEAIPPGWLKPLITGGNLSCDVCDFKSQAAPSMVALWGVRPVVAALLLYAAVTKIFEAQRIPESKSQFLAFAIGFLIFGAAAAVWYTVGGAASPKLLQGRILGHRRRHEDKLGGVVAPKVGGGFGEQLEAIVVAVILALIIRHFVMEAFVIPTGSMAPTLLGDHFEVTCSRCQHEFPVGKTERELQPGSGELVVDLGVKCPLCRLNQRRDVSRSDVVGGHKILVNKFLYAFRGPKRYEVVVFKKPGEPSRNYIKRLVGLPGETLRIVNGDLFVIDDEGRAHRARRPDGVQDAIWIALHDSAFTRDPGQLRTPWWNPEGEGKGAWQFGQEGSLDTDGLWMKCTPRGEGPAWISYAERINTRYGYARTEGTTRSDPTSDVRVRVNVTGEDGALVRLAIRETSPGVAVRSKRVVTARFPVGTGSGEYAIEIDGQVAETVTAKALTPGRKHELTLAYADDRARLRVDGVTVMTWEDPFGPEKTIEAEVLIAASKAPVVFEHTRIDRDIHYTKGSGGQWSPGSQDVTIPDNAYFCMGDNSPNSLDSRAWGFVHEGYMIGRAFLIFWPADPKHVRLIR